MSYTTKLEERLVRLVTPNLGTDPELFLAASDGDIIGAERVIDKEGLKMPQQLDPQTGKPMVNRNIVLDGVQLELHPAPSTCRQSLAAGLAILFQNLRNALATREDGVRASFEPVVHVSKKEMDQLSDAAKTLGCAPSLNAAKANATVKVAKRDALMRSAGGHIHMGIGALRPLLAADNGKGAKPLVDLFDILCGLPCVLLDRDPNAAKRRRVYGRAGEYRLPAWGIEYRVPSNFWLRNYLLMHFVTGQLTQALDVWTYSTHEAATACGGKASSFNFAADLTKRVDMKNVHKAINRNDLELARREWKKVAAWIEEHVPTYPIYGKGLSSGIQLLNFDYFAEVIAEKGLQYWFPDDPMVHWCGSGRNRPGVGGFESYMFGSSQVQQERFAAASRIPGITPSLQFPRQPGATAAERAA